MRAGSPDDVCYTLGEEIAHAVSHGIGLVAVLSAAPFLVAAAWAKGPVAVAAVTIFAVTVASLYLASTLYHALPQSRAKRVFRVLDHSAIFLVIAGTYTPFTLGILRGAWGWTLFGFVWSVAIAGIMLKAVGGIRYPRLFTTLYVALGWTALVASRPLWFHMPVAGWLWLIAGGLAYTAGVGFYAAHRVRYAHFVWHLFVLAGTACHYFAVLWYSA
jgi:hemolysin III